MIFDTHAHYDDEQFDGDRDELLKSMPDLGVGTIVDVSATYDSCEKVLAVTKKWLQSERSVWIIIGIMNHMRYSRSGLSASWSLREK